MKYDKPPLTFDGQVRHLLERGVQGDPDVMRERLASVNYYRLSGHLFPFRNPDNQTYRPGTSFDEVWQRYAFDRRLRLLVMDAIERIEIAIRTQLPYHHAHAYNDPFAYSLKRSESKGGYKIEPYNGLAETFGLSRQLEYPPIFTVGTPVAKTNPTTMR